MSTEVYTESESHIPNPTDQVGTLDTSGTAGAAHGKLEEVTPIFGLAADHDALVAAAALDPENKDVPEYMVTMPQGTVVETLDKDAIKERLVTKAEAVKDDPTVMGAPSPAQQKAAEETETKTENKTSTAPTGSTTPTGAGSAAGPGTQSPAAQAR